MQEERQHERRFTNHSAGDASRAGPLVAARARALCWRARASSILQIEAKIVM